MTTQSNKRKFLATTLTATMVAAAVAPVAGVAAAENVSFPDVPADHAYAGVIKDMAAAGIVKGGTDGNFNLGGNITRAEAAQMVAGLLDLKTGPEANTTKFTDVKTNEWYTGAINSLVSEGIIAGVSEEVFEPGANITRGQLAQLLVVAYGLEDVDVTDVKLPFTDVDEKAWYTKPIKQLYSEGLINGQTANTFGPKSDMKRGDFAWLAANVDYAKGDKLPKPQPEVTEGITSVKAINDTKIEVTFGKAIDKDVAREIEKEVKRFVGFNGGQTERAGEFNFNVTYVTFTDGYKKAELTIDQAPKEDINYTIALLDGEDNRVADVVYKSKPVVLKTSAEQPTLSVDTKQEKFVLDFKTKMKDSAKDLSNFEIVDEHGQTIKDAEDNEITDLSKIAAGEVNWVDATAKTKVEFKLKPGALEAGKTYKVKVNEGVITDKGEELSGKKDTITVKTPLVNESRPEAKIIRLNKENIQITFDRDLSKADKDQNINERLVKVKTATGKDVEFGDITVDGKTVTIAAKSGEEFDVKSSYTVTLPENAVANDMFRNALNKAVNSMKAVAQDNIAVSSMTAAFDRQVDNKEVADLLLKFDQAVKVPTEDFVLTIEEAGKSQKVTVNASDVELDTNDISGKTLRLKDFTKAFTESTDIKEIKNDKTYTIKVAAGQVTTDSADENQNSKELKTTVGGINIIAPAIDSVEYVSEEKIVVEFKQEISTDLSAEDVTVQGYQLLRAGNFEQIALNDKNYINVSVSGKKVTITPADKDIKFITGEKANGVDQAVVFKENSVKAKDSEIVAVDELTTANLDAEDVTDNAKPVIIGSTVTGEHGIEITYSENVDFKAGDDEDKVNQFSFEGLEYKNFKTTTATITDNNVVAITFEDQDAKYGPVFDVTKSSFPNVKVIYRAHSDFGLEDAAAFNANKASNATFTGASKKVN